MNTEKLHAIALAIRNDVSKSRVIAQLDTLVDALENMVNQPNQPTYQKSFSDARDALRNTLIDSQINNFSPAWKQVVSELGGSEFLGYPLWSNMEQIFSENTITPQVALDDIRAIREDVNNFVGSIEKVVDSFERLKVGSEKLEPGQCEIGILIPRDFVHNRLKEFGEEIDKLNKILSVFSELVTGARPGFEIRAISSSDLSVFLRAAVPVCTCIAVSIERIVALYKNLLEIKKLRSDMERQGVPDSALKGVGDHAEQVMDDGILKLVDDLANQFLKNTESGRANEIKIELRYSLKRIAARIDRGFNIEVRMAEPDKIDADEGADMNEHAPSYEVIKRRRKICNLLRSAEILSLVFQTTEVQPSSD